MGKNGLISRRGKILKSSNKLPKAELRGRFLNLIELPMDMIFEVHLGLILSTIPAYNSGY
jgi:hypothetical protein